MAILLPPGEPGLAISTSRVLVRRRIALATATLHQAAEEEKMPAYLETYLPGGSVTDMTICHAAGPSIRAVPASRVRSRVVSTFWRQRGVTPRPLGQP